MRLLLLGSVLFVLGLACAAPASKDDDDDDDDFFGDADTDADSDTDADADTDTDTDTDTDADTDTDTDSDTDVGTDADGDGFPARSDCDDSDPYVYPGAEEDCNGVDDDCDEQVDEDGSSYYFRDYDGDGFGDPHSEVEGCEPAEGYVSNSTDCDDRDSGVYPGADESCTNEQDDDCDGDVDAEDSDAEGCSYTDLVGEMALLDGTIYCTWDSVGVRVSSSDCRACDFAFEVQNTETTSICVGDIETHSGWEGADEVWHMYWNGSELGPFDATMTYGSRYDTVEMSGLSIGSYMFYGEFRLY